MTPLLSALLYLVLAPLAGCLLAGLDRVATARMQRRKGPPLLQPYYDIRKLMGKQAAEVNRFQGYYLAGFLCFTAGAGALFFGGGDLLLVIFALTLGAVMLVLAAFSAHTPFAHLGAHRELLQMLAYEPMLILTALGLFLATHSFGVAEIADTAKAPVLVLPGIFVGYLFILTIKLRKSPFDLSSAHHAHQELVRGLTVEISGGHLALVELAHWYENVLLLGILYLFLAPFGWALALAGVALCYLIEIVVDNSSARLRWETALRSSWLVALILGGANILLVPVLLRGW
jgi:ech hydrogenase subunit B